MEEKNDEMPEELNEEWMRLGMEASEKEDYERAFEYFKKAVEEDPANWRAVYEKGKAKAQQSTPKKRKTSKLSEGIRKALEIIKALDLSKEELTDIKNEFVTAIYDINVELTDRMDYELEEKWDDLHYKSDWNRIVRTFERYREDFYEMEYGLSLIRELDDEVSKGNTLELKKRVCEDIRNICSSIGYWLDRSETMMSEYGYNSAEKKTYLEKYLEYLMDIRTVEPGYATESHQYPNPFNTGKWNPEAADQYWKRKIAERK